MSRVEHQGFYVLILASIHDVMAAEAAIQQAGPWCDMIPTPRQLSSDCGMALRIGSADWPTIRALLAGRPIRLRGVYHEFRGAYEAVGD